MTLNDQIRDAVANFDVDPTVLGRVVDRMRFQHRMNHTQVCTLILQVCPEITAVWGDVDSMLYACDAADALG